jgi:hypothetical protein
VYVARNTYEGGGKLWESAVQRICAALLVYQIVVGAVLLGYEFVPGAIIVFLCCLVTIIYWKELNKRLKYVKALPLEECENEKNVRIEDEKNVRIGEYKNPALEPLEQSKEREPAPSV